MKISMIKNLLGSRYSFIPHSRVQSNIVWSRLLRAWYGYHQRENTGSRLFTEVKLCWTGLSSITENVDFKAEFTLSISSVKVGFTDITISILEKSHSLLFFEASFQLSGK